MQTDLEYITGIRAAAKFAGVSVKRLGDEMDHFHFPFIVVDRKFIFLKASLEQLVA